MIDDDDEGGSSVGTPLAERRRLIRLEESVHAQGPEALRSSVIRLSYFGGALDAGLAASAAAAFFRDSFAACFLSAAILRGLGLSTDELPSELPCKTPVLSEAPGVPGVR